jgi:hypothetical protein
LHDKQAAASFHDMADGIFLPLSECRTIMGGTYAEQLQGTNRVIGHGSVSLLEFSESEYLAHHALARRSKGNVVAWVCSDTSSATSSDKPKAFAL